MPVSEMVNYGDELARRLRLEEASASLVKAQSKSQLAITRLASMHGLKRLTDHLTPEKSFSLSVHLIEPDSARWGTWVDGVLHPVNSWSVGGIGLYDLESDPIALRDTQFDFVHFNVPRSTLNAFTDQSDLPRVRNLPLVQGEFDSVFHHLAMMILPSIGTPQVFSELFWDQFVLILCTHLTQQYAKLTTEAGPYRSGLAPWQRRKATEYIHAHLVAGFRLEAVAEECRLSPSHFSRAFKVTFGNSVHRHFTNLRIERAKTLLKQSDYSLVEIALASGFPDQSGLCRTFAMCTGTSPARWRREHQTHPPTRVREAFQSDFSLSVSL